MAEGYLPVIEYEIPVFLTLGPVATFVPLYDERLYPPKQLTFEERIHSLLLKPGLWTSYEAIRLWSLWHLIPKRTSSIQNSYTLPCGIFQAHKPSAVHFVPVQLFLKQLNVFQAVHMSATCQTYFW